MEELEKLLPVQLYHSYIVQTNNVAIVDDLRSVLEKRGEITSHSLDVLTQSYDAFTIADSAIVKEWHKSKNATSKKKVCIIFTKFINNDAQHSLLKILEEPQEGTHFFLVVPNIELLLETIRSRVHTIFLAQTSEAQQARAFIKASKKERLELVATLIETHKDAVGSGGLRHAAISLLSDIEKEIYVLFHKKRDDEHIQFLLTQLKLSREYLSLPGAAVKMILEHIALVI